jgi:tRNA modification GTPase
LADGVLVVLDASRGWTPQDRQVLESAGEACIAVLWNKTDIVPPQRARALTQHPALREVRVPVLAVSAEKGAGLGDLQRTIICQIGNTASLPEDDLVTNERHARALLDAQCHINSALARLQDGDEPALAAADLRDAADTLGVIIGVATPEDVIHQIFSRFCVGK